VGIGSAALSLKQHPLTLSSAAAALRPSTPAPALRPPHPAAPFVVYLPLTLAPPCTALYRRRLRHLFGVDNSAYILSICGDQALREMPSPGKSGRCATAGPTACGCVCAPACGAAAMCKGPRCACVCVCMRGCMM
jgi:hypothetical protein